MLVKTKYNGTLELSRYMDHLIKSVFRILPMWENEEDWEKYLAGLQVELAGLEELSMDVSFISLISKLEGLSFVTELSLVRKTIFDSISLIEKIKKDGEVA